MDVRSASFTAGSIPNRLLLKEGSVPRVALRGTSVRAQGRGTAPPNSVAGAENYESESDNDANRRVQRSSADEESRKRVEVVTGLLREGYGVGAILTAAAFRGAALTSDVLKGLSQSGTAAVRRTRRLHTKRPPHNRTDPTLVERLQQAMTESLATPIRWHKKDEHVLKAESQSESDAAPGNEFFEEEATAEMAFEDGRVAELEEREEGVMVMKEVLGIPEDEPLSSRHISEGGLKPSAFLSGAEEGLFGTAELPDEISEEAQRERSDFEETDLGGLDVTDVLEDLAQEEAVLEATDAENALAELETVSNAQDDEEAAVEETEIGLEASDSEVVVEEPEAVASEETVLEAPIEDSLAAEREMTPIQTHPETVSTEETELTLTEEALLEAADDTTRGEAPEVVEQSEELSVGAELVEESPIEQPLSEDQMEDLVTEDVEGDRPSEDLSTEARIEDTLPEKSEDTVESVFDPSAEEEESGDSSLVMNRAKEILDEIANFEIEVGESVDGPEQEAPETEEPAPEPEPPIEAPPPPLQRSKAEIEKELKAEMRREAEKRLRAMKIGNEPRFQHESPVKVERPPSERGSKASVPMGRPSKDFKGLDYIKSYAKESQGHLRGETPSGDSSKDASSAFFTPPSILQDPKKPPPAQAASREYSQWTELDRLQRVREIGTVLWRGRGGNGGSGGSGGSGGNGGSGDSSDDNNWWIQVGVSMMTMTALVFALLTAVSNQLDKQQRSKSQANSN